MILGSKDFKNAVSAAGKFPPLGDFAGAGSYILSGENGVFQVHAAGVVSAWAKCRIREGELSPVSVDMRFLNNYAGLIPEGRSVSLTVEHDTMTLVCGRRHGVTAVRAAKKRKSPKPAENRREFSVTDAMAKRCGYLAEVAFADGSKAELACVMLTLNSAMAANQTTAASFRIDSQVERVALPLPLARVLEAGNKLYAGEADTVLRGRNVLYLAPAAVKAQKEFPVRAMQEYGEQSVEEIAVVNGEKFAAGLMEQVAVLESLSRLEIVIDLSVGGKDVRMRAGNAGSEYDVRVPLLRSIKHAKFKIPLSEAKKIVPFLSGRVILTRARHGDLLLKLPDGWSLFPAWIAPKQK